MLSYLRFLALAVVLGSSLTAEAAPVWNPVIQTSKGQVVGVTGVSAPVASCAELDTDHLTSDSQATSQGASLSLTRNLPSVTSASTDPAPSS